MVVQDSTLSVKVAQGSTGFYKDVHDRTRLYIVCTWLYKVVHSRIWLYKAVYGCIWL